MGTGILGSDRGSKSPLIDERETLVNRLGITVIPEREVIPEVHPKGRVSFSVAAT